MAEFVGVALAVAAVCTFVQFSARGLQQDDYYHIRAAHMLRTRGIERTFPWLEHTVFRDRNHDMHFLFHVLLIPFTFGNLVTGAKIAAVSFTTALAAATLWYLRRRGVGHEWFWVLLLVFGSSSFLTRLLSLRPIALSTLFLVLALLVLAEGRPVWLAPLGYAYTLSYSAFPLLLLLAVVHVGAVWIRERRLDPRPLLYALGGVVAGLVFNPFFPNNLRVQYVQIVRGSLLRSELLPNLEWMPLSSWALFLSAWGTILCVFLCLLWALWRGRRSSGHAAAVFLMASASLFGFLRYARGVDQFVPFATVWSGLVVRFREGKHTRWAWLVLAAGLAVTAVLNVRTARVNLRAADSADRSGAAEWLLNNSPEGSEVFLSSYGAFPELFFFNRHNVYTLGHDSLFLRDHDAALYAAYVDVVLLRGDPYPILKDDFGASYIHLDNTPQQARLYAYLSGRPDRFEPVFRDSSSALFAVR